MEGFSPALCILRSTALFLTTLFSPLIPSLLPSFPSSIPLIVLGSIFISFDLFRLLVLSLLNPLSFLLYFFSPSSSFNPSFSLLFISPFDLFFPHSPNFPLTLFPISLMSFASCYLSAISLPHSSVLSKILPCIFVFIVVCLPLLFLFYYVSVFFLFCLVSFNVLG